MRVAVHDNISLWPPAAGRPELGQHNFVVLVCDEVAVVNKASNAADAVLIGGSRRAPVAAVVPVVGVATHSRDWRRASRLRHSWQCRRTSAARPTATVRGKVTTAAEVSQLLVEEPYDRSPMALEWE